MRSQDDPASSGSDGAVSVPSPRENPPGHHSRPARKASRFRRGRIPRWFWVAVPLACALTAWGALTWIDLRRLHAELFLAEREMAAGQFDEARARLLVLSAGHPGRSDVAYQLGVCEQSRGRREAALAALARVAPNSPWFVRASVMRATSFINAGRYSHAEDALEHARSAPRTSEEGQGILRALSRVYRFEGRVNDVRRILRESWVESNDPTGVLKELWLLDNSPQPVEALQRSLERADDKDERVWLGRANLAILIGRFDEASRWLEECARRTPNDPLVWRARLDLATASGDTPGVLAAASHLTADRFTEPEVLELRAWLAARGNDREVERRALEVLVKADPGRASALDQLASLAFEAGHHKETERLHRRKAEIDQVKDRVRKLLLNESDLAARAEELAEHSRTLGRTFDAWAWSVVAARHGRGVRPAGGTQEPPSAPPTDPPVARRGVALSALLADLVAKPTHSPGVPAARLAVPHFTDDAEAAGLSFVFDNGATPLQQLPETMSGGVAVLDFDGDGWLDVYVVQGGPIEVDSDAAPNGDRLFRNNRDGTFRDVSAPSRITSFRRDYSLGVTIGDVDNDGRPDIFVTRLSSYALYRNLGDGTFRDVTAEAGLAGRRDNPTSAAFADLDSDGDLDLYVCHYMKWDRAHPRLCANEKGGYFYCDPSKVDPAPDHVFRNDGGRFTDVTEAAGFTDPDGRGLGVVAADLDGDNRIDLYVANDGTANFLFHNRGGFRFEERALVAGVAAGPEGGYQASMGVACGDQDGDGRLDLLVTNFYGESSTLYHNLGDGLFRDNTADSGLGAATRYLLGFGTWFADFNNDGRLDLATTNGHVNDNRPFYPYAMPSLLLLGSPSGRFFDVSARSGDAWLTPRVGRGLAVADLDNDGRLDVLIVAQNDRLAYLHNRTEAPALGQDVTFRLEGTKSNRDAVGAQVAIVAGGRRQVAQRMGGGSYQSACDPRVHFGIGAASLIESVEVRWPSGRVDRFERLAAGTGYLLREGAPAAVPLAAFSKP